MKRFLILLAIMVASGWLIAQTSDGFGPEELAVTAPVVASGGGGGSIAQVQTKTYTSTSGSTTHAVTLDATPTENNLLVLCVSGQGTIASPPSGYTQAGSAVDFEGTYIFYKIAGASESATVTVTESSSVHAILWFAEYSGTATSSVLDQNDGNTAQTATINSGPVTTTVADELLVSVFGYIVSAGLPDLISLDNSFTTETELNAPASAVIGMVVGTKIVSATGSQSCAATMSTDTSGGHNTAVIATFKAL